MTDEQLRALIKKLAEALEPFADVDGEGDEDFGDETPVIVKFGRTIHYPVRLGDLRRARAVWGETYDANLCEFRVDAERRDRHVGLSR